MLLGGICECLGCASEWRTDPVALRGGGVEKCEENFVHCCDNILNAEREETVRRGERGTEIKG